MNTAAVGLSLAAATSIVLSSPLDALRFGEATTRLALMIPTLIIGTVWAARLRHADAPRHARGRWLASIPLAALNAAWAAALLIVLSGPSWRDPAQTLFLLLAGGMIGALFGVVVWGPALAVTLLVYGMPIAAALRAARKGLAGEDRGEVRLGIACGIVALLALWPAVAAQPAELRDPAGVWGIRVCALLGLLGGTTAALLAHERERQRRAFVRGAQAGAVAHYRVEESAAGRVLVHVPEGPAGYRVADVPEPICELDETGEALRIAGE